MKRIPDSILVGIVANILATVLGVILFALFFSWFKHSSFKLFIQSVLDGGSQAITVIGLAQVLSIPVFYLFINRNKTRSAQGIILMFLLLAITTGLYKIL